MNKEKILNCPICEEELSTIEVIEPASYDAALDNDGDPIIIEYCGTADTELDRHYRCRNCGYVSPDLNEFVVEVEREECGHDVVETVTDPFDNDIEIEVCQQCFKVVL